MTQFIFVAIATLVGLYLLRRNLAAIRSDRDPPAPPPDFHADVQSASARLERIARAAVAAPSKVPDELMVAPPPAEPAEIGPPAEQDNAKGAVDEHIELQAKQAVLFRPHVAPRHDALSHWGGVPLLPVDLNWPSFATPEGDIRPLSFILQLDLADVPADARLELLPETGLLQLYVDLDWGKYWEWRWLHIDADPATLSPATPPADLPIAFGDLAVWEWAQRAEDAPRLLPFVSVDPILIRADPEWVPDDEDGVAGRLCWPAGMNLREQLERAHAMAPHRSFDFRSVDGVTQRPFANFPHDWGAIRVVFGYHASGLDRATLKRYVDRGDMTENQVASLMAKAKATISDWLARAADRGPFQPLDQADSDAAWQFLADHRSFLGYKLKNGLRDSVLATLGGNPEFATVLPPAAIDMARSAFALGVLMDDGNTHINSPDRMLGAPTVVQWSAEEKVIDNLLLLEMSSNEALGHHFAEGVYQFWITPDDLASRRFNKVELIAEAY